MTTELLEQRLAALAEESPNPAAVSTRVLARPPRRGVPAWSRVSLGVVATIALVALVAYLVR